jgi:hypothetical protein
MNAYDSRRITLDPGLTALALRGLNRRSEHYPFLDRHTRLRGLSQSIRRGWTTWFPTAHMLFAAHRSAG